MRLSYLDILEQCFHDKFRGYNKQEVDTFLHLVSDDFKSMSEEIKEKERIIATKDNEIKVLLADLESRPAEIDNRIPQEVEEKLTHLRKQIEEKDQFIKKMQARQRQGENGDNPFSQLTPEMLKQKAKRIVNAAKNQAEQHRQNAIKELEQLMQDIEKLKKQKLALMENIKNTTSEHLSKFKAGMPNGPTGNAD